MGDARGRQRSSCAGSQTEPLSSADSGSQFPETNSVQTQCHGSRRAATINDNQVDFDRLLRFLQSSEPLVHREIEKSVRTFKRWRAMERLWNIDDSRPELLHRFTSDHVRALQEGDPMKSRQQYAVSCVCWNSSASILLVAYRVNEAHSEWCSHESFLFLWNLYKSNDDRMAKPTLVLDIDAGCVSTMEAHPRAASVFAIGTVRGKVIVINSRYTGSGSGGENYVRASNQTVIHQDSVSCVHWVNDERMKDHLVSLGLDGRIYLWKLSNDGRRSLQLVSAFVILVQDLPRSLGIKSAAGSESLVGITSASFSYEDATVFIVGCHGGAMFQCSLLSTAEAAQQPAVEVAGGVDRAFCSPLVVTFVPHRGHVNSMQFSRALRNTFLSSASDGELRIYSMLNTKPLMVIHGSAGILQASWTVTRDHCVYVLQEDGLIAVYNVENRASANRPAFVLPMEERQRALLFAVNLAERREQLAISYAKGDTLLYDLSKVFPASCDNRAVRTPASVSVTADPE